MEVKYFRLCELIQSMGSKYSQADLEIAGYYFRKENHIKINDELTWCGFIRESPEDREGFADGSVDYEKGKIIVKTLWIYQDVKCVCVGESEYRYFMCGHSGGVDDIECKSSKVECFKWLGFKVKLPVSLITDVTKYLASSKYDKYKPDVELPDEKFILSENGLTRI